MKRILIALLLALAIAAGVSPVQAYTPAVGTGVDRICGIAGTNGQCGTAGGLLERGGRYYMMTVAHVTPELGSVVADRNGKHIGPVAYRSTAADIALIYLGTVRPKHNLIIGYTAEGAPIKKLVSSRASAYVEGTRLYATGWSFPLDSHVSRTDLRVYQGFAGSSCPATYCGLKADSGDTITTNGPRSGSVVYAPKADNTVEFHGILSNVVGSSPNSGLYRSAWLFEHHNWTASETLAGHPLGCCSAIQSSTVIS